MERAARVIHFDFDALCRRILPLFPGARAISWYEKKEDGFNRVFVFHMNNGKCVVARLPFGLAGPKGSITNLEVATIKYCEYLL